MPSFHLHQRNIIPGVSTAQYILVVGNWKINKIIAFYIIFDTVNSFIYDEIITTPLWVYVYESRSQQSPHQHPLPSPRGWSESPKLQVLILGEIISQHFQLTKENLAKNNVLTAWLKLVLSG